MSKLIGKTITNTNGKQYEVIDKFASYSILKQLNRQADEEYIVAWCLDPHGDYYTWGQGHYHSTLESAREDFKECTAKNNAFKVGIIIPTFCDQKYLRDRDEYMYGETEEEAIENYKKLAFRDYLNEDERKAVERGQIKIGLIE